MMAKKKRNCNMDKIYTDEGRNDSQKRETKNNGVIL